MGDGSGRGSGQLTSVGPVLPVPSTGAEVAGRYRLERLLGGREGAVTFEARDTTLSRPVAVRFLAFDALATVEWREWVRHELTAVAALHHPNLLRIYDWGEDNGTPYVVTEYLAGGSLREILVRRGTLPPEETALLGLEAATALAYAHAREFVHGALRPSKLLFDEEGRVRVSGLGLDAALEGTAPLGAGAIEAANYLSPEQVNGATVEGRTDVYALSLILYECLTGRVPHPGRTLEAVRAARIGAPLPHRPELGPLDLTLALGAAPEPAARPDADLFANRLAAVAASLPPAGPVPAEPMGGFRPPTAEAMLTGPAVAVSSRVTGDTEVVRPFDRPGYRERIVAAKPTVPPPPERQRPGWALLVVAVLILVAIGGAIAWKAGAFAASYKVPPVTGIDPKAAEALVAGHGISIKIVGTTYSASVPLGEIVTQSPVPGTSLSSGGSIRVIISEGNQSVSIPPVVTVLCSVAQNELHNVGFKASCATARTQPSASVRAGAVVAVYDGTALNPVSAPFGTTLTLVVSSGPPPTSSTSSTTTSTVPGSPTTTTSTSTTTTTIPPSQSVAVPNVVGDDPAQLYAAMKQAVLYYKTEGPGSPNSWTTVVSTDPAAGTVVKKYSTVIVTVKK